MRSVPRSVPATERVWPSPSGFRQLAAADLDAASDYFRQEAETKGDGCERQTVGISPESESGESNRVDGGAEAARQWAMIAELASALNVSPVRYWLMGGWAVDAHLGRTTRQHSDVDFAVFLADRAALTDALGQHGRVPAPGGEPAGEFFEGGACRVEITYLAETLTGEVVTPSFEFWPYLSGAFDAQVVVGGVVVPVMSFEALIDTKLHWQDQLGEPMRPQDRADLDALRALTTE